MGRDCRFRLVEASKGADGEPTLTPKQAENLLNEIKEAAQKRVGEDIDIDDALIAELAERKILAKQNSALQKRNAMINIVKERELTTKVEQFIDEGLGVRKSFQALLVGINGIYNEGRLSVDNKSKTLSKKYLGSLVKELDENNLLRAVNEKTLNKEIERELWELSKSDGKAGLTGSKEALQAAKIIYKHTESLRVRQNRAGAAIGKLESFTTTQTHDRTAMRSQGYTKWRDTILPLLDQERTFKGADADEFLQSSYEVLTTGVSRKQLEPDKLFDFKGPSNLAKKISKPRVLHFKDADSAIAYREAFGKRDFMEGVLQSIEHSSRNISLLETFGTNPRAMFERILDKTQGKYRGDLKKVAKDGDIRAINNFFDEIEGLTLIPEAPKLAQVGSVIRAFQSMSKLGGALISSLSDIPMKASELQFQGRGIFESYGITLGDIAHGLGSKERRHFGSLLGVGFDGMAGGIAARFTAQDDLPGKLSKFQRIFFKLNGLEWWTDVQKLGTGLAMSHNLAQMKKLSFGSLDADTQRLFKNFGINETDWNLIKQSAVKELDGREYITPDSIQFLPDELFGKNAQAAKDKLEDKLRGYIIDRVDYATITPDARERAILTQGSRRGTVWGELSRVMTQFKSFPVTVLSKVYGRMLYGKGKADVPAIVQTAIMSTLMGYVAMTGKDLAKGREPRPLDELATWNAAFLQGGGAGIMGDFLLGEYNRFGQTFSTTLAGPTAGTIDDLARIYSALKNGDDAAAKSVNFMINNAPFANLFYLRPALNYMFIYQLQEAMNPGYLRRMERRVEKENNQKFLIKPSSAL